MGKGPPSSDPEAAGLSPPVPAPTPPPRPSFADFGTSVVSMILIWRRRNFWTGPEAYQEAGEGQSLLSAANIRNASVSNWCLLVKYRAMATHVSSSLARSAHATSGHDKSLVSLRNQTA